MNACDDTAHDKEECSEHPLRILPSPFSAIPLVRALAARISSADQTPLKDLRHRAAFRPIGFGQSSLQPASRLLPDPSISRPIQV